MCLISVFNLSTLHTAMIKHATKTVKSSLLKVSLFTQVPTTVEIFCSYGPVHPHGYGVCYNPQSDYILFSVSSLHESPQTCSAAFVKSLVQGLLDMRDLCNKGCSDTKKQGQKQETHTQTEINWQHTKPQRQVDHTNMQQPTPPQILLKRPNENKVEAHTQTSS